MTLPRDAFSRLYYTITLDHKMYFYRKSVITYISLQHNLYSHDYYRYQSTHKEFHYEFKRAAEKINTHMYIFEVN